MKRGSWKRPGAQTDSPTSLVTRRYRSANIALWSHESAIGSKRFVISRSIAATHCSLPDLQMLGSSGSYPADRLGKSIDQSVTGSWMFARSADAAGTATARE